MAPAAAAAETEESDFRVKSKKEKEREKKEREKQRKKEQVLSFWLILGPSIHTDWLNILFPQAASNKKSLPQQKADEKKKEAEYATATPQPASKGRKLPKHMVVLQKQQEALRRQREDEERLAAEEKSLLYMFQKEEEEKEKKACRISHAQEGERAWGKETTPQGRQTSYQGSKSSIKHKIFVQYHLVYVQLSDKNNPHQPQQVFSKITLQVDKRSILISFNKYLI